jgi:hypothetical protein
MRVEDFYMRMKTPVFVSVLALALAFAAVVEAGGKGKNRKKGDKNSDNSSGTIEFILDHAAELKLSPEQTQKLDTLLSAEELITADTVINAIMQKVREAGNQQGLEEQKQRLSEKIKEKTGGKFGLLKDDLAKILTPEQMTTLAALRSKNAPAAKDGGTKDDSKPGEGRVNPFEL